MRTTRPVMAFAVSCLLFAVLLPVNLAGQRGGGRQGAAAAAPQKEELSETYRGSQRNNVEYQKVAPFRVFDNLHYVGPGFVSVWLISTPDGLILLDAAQEKTALKLYKHPGHTTGSLSVEFTVFDGGRPYKAFMMGGPGPRGGVAGAEQFLESANRVAKIEAIQVAVPVHSWLNDFHYPNGGIFERAQKLAQRRPGDPHPFVDPASWSEWVRQVQEGAVKNLADEKQKAAGSAAR